MYYSLSIGCKKCIYVVRIISVVFCARAPGVVKGSRYSTVVGSKRAKTTK